MQHIVLISTSYPDGFSDTEAAGSFVEDFARELAKHNQVSVLAPALQASHETSGNLNVIRFSVPTLPLSTLNPFNLRDLLSIVTTLRAGKRSLASMVSTHKINHILALWALPSGYWARQIAKKIDTPYSTWSLGSDIWSLGKIPGVRHVLKQVLFDAQSRYADGLELCRAVEDIGKKECLFMPSTRNVPYVPHREATQRAPYQLAFLGRWHTNKGTDLLLDALLLLSEKDWSKIAEIRIFGGGPLNDVVHRQCHELVNADRPVSVGGYLDKTAAAELMGWADYLLIPSRIESIPVVFSDAMKCHTPVISTPVGDLPDLISRYECGITATAVTSQSFADAISKALNASAQSFETGIKKAGADFDLQTIVSRFINDIQAETTQ